MKIKQIHIYGYGQFINYKLNDLANLQVIYGQNEAGKTTLMSFIHSILFGFPTRQQAALRYEPKTHSSYGGKIVLQTKAYGEVTVERVKGKATGDVTVILEDGKLEDEQFLFQHIVQTMDQAMYESIFSFNLHRIQEVHRLKKDDIGKYLIAAGTIGTDLLLQIDDQFQKELDDRFKPGGRKPKLNVQLKEVREKERELNEAKMENALYETIQSNLASVKQKLANTNNKLARLMTQKQRKEALLKEWPLLIETEQIEQRLLGIGSICFPTDGINRYEKYDHQMIQVSSKLKANQERIVETKKEMEENAPNLNFDPIQTERIIKEWSHYERLLEKGTELKRLIQEDQDQMQFIMNELHYDHHATQIENMNLGIDNKEKLQEATKRYVRIETQMDEIERQRLHGEHVLNELEQKCAAIEKQLIDEKKFNRWKKQYETRQSTQLLQKERQAIEEEMILLENQNRLEQKTVEKQIKQTFIFSASFAIISGLILIWAIFSSHWFISIFAIVALIYSLFALRMRNKSKNQTENDLLRLVRKRYDEVSSLIGKDEQGMEDIAFRYEQQMNLREEWKRSFRQIEHQRQQVEHLKEQQQEVDRQFERVNEQLSSLKAELGLDIHFANERIEDAFQLLKRLQQLKNQNEKREDRFVFINKRQNEWTSMLKELASKLSIDSTEPEEIIFTLKKLQIKEREKKIVHQECMKKLAELQDEVLLLEKEQDELNKVITHLFRQANVENEEQFRIKANEYAEMNRLKERLKLLDVRIDQSAREKLVDYQSKGDIHTHIISLEKSIDQLTRELNDLRNKQAAFQHEIRELEQGGTFTEKLHQFHQVKSIFNEEAVEWAKIAVAKALLQKTMDKYKQDRLPKVIRQASEYFSFLTVGAYDGIYVQPEGNLLIKRADGLLFDPSELSQGTAEQLYIAIRFALVIELNEDYPLPVMIDDSFVNFDEKRVDRVIKLIHQLKNVTQILFFTCHDHLLEHFPKTDVLQISNEKRSIVNSAQNK